jgi:anti-sigma B factor antagonist
MELRQKLVDSAIRVIAVIGEMDMYNSHELKAVVTNHFVARKGPLILDLAELRYIDSSGVGVLIYVFTQARRGSIPIWFANVHGTVRRVIELTSLLNFFPITNSVDDAVQRARSV